ncbi:hypothetical protein BaRGS_00005584 [Batillaria attramentaria]|uniref:Apple domain-containing protein n=1 Tax=Batillaria attramentaria TaxID=370345 RepID=A0ABD0LWA8_9CAEN
MTNTFASIVVGVLLTSRLHTISGSIFRQKTAVQNPDLADVVFVANLLFTFNARSPADCARACLGNHGCLTYTITPGAAATSCRGHTSVMTSSDANLPMPGTTLFTFGWSTHFG